METTVNNVKATLVCSGRFHFFDLARELLKRGMLKIIFTGYPNWKLINEDIPAEFLKTFPWLQTPYVALDKFEFIKGSLFQQEFSWLVHETFDRYVSTQLPETDVLFALSGSGLRCGRLAQKRGAKYICDRASSHIVYQASLLEEEFKRWGDSFKGITQRMIDREENEYALADIVTVPSTFAYRSFVKMGISESKLRRIPYGVDTRLFKNMSSPKLDRFNVLFAGQISFQKGVPYLLKAFNYLHHPRKRLIFAGTMCPEMRRYFNRHPPSENVEFLGHINQHKLNQIMCQSHVLVLPSIQEGLAYVQAQALACGCPVIGTPNTGAEDLFTNEIEGFIVPIRDPQSIADKLQILADNPDRRSAMSEAALQRVAQIGGWFDYGQRISQLLNELVS